MIDLAKLVVRLEAQSAQLLTELERANNKIDKFSKSTTGLLKDVAVAFATYLAADKLIEWGQHVLEGADHLAKLSQSTGVAVPALSELQYVFKQGGIDSEGFNVSLRKLNQQVSDAAGNVKGEGAAAFRAMGVHIKDASGNLKSANAILSDVADKFATYADGANKVALATALFGKAGEQLIPTLNQGADGIARLRQEAIDTGAAISEKTAKSAEEFNDKLSKLKTTLVDGIGNRITAELLPALNALADEFSNAADKTGLLDRASQVGATALKIFASAAARVVFDFDRLQATLGATGAAVVAFVSGRFSEAATIMREAQGDIADRDAAFQKRIKAIWHGGDEDLLEEIKVTTKKILEQAPNVAAAKVTSDAADTALKKLKELNEGLAEQVATFDTTNAAALTYRLTLGKLSDDVKAAGAAGKEQANQIEATAAALDHLQRAKEVAAALVAINAQISELKGNSAEAALAQFDQSNQELVKKLRLEGNEAGLAQVDTLRKLIGAQADYNQLQQQAEEVQNDLAITEERIRNSQSVGATTDLDALEQLGAARAKAAAQLDAIYQQQKKIADESGNPQLIQNAKKFGAAIEDLRAQVDLLGQKVVSVFEDSLASSLGDVIDGTKTAKEAFSDFISSVVSQLSQLAAKQLVQQAFGSLSSTESGSSGSGLGSILGAIVGAFGGGKAGGGAVNAGVAYTVGENGPERFVPDTAGRVEKAGAWNQSMTVQQTFVLPPEGATRQTQQQIGAAAARGLGVANRRNN